VQTAGAATDTTKSSAEMITNYATLAFTGVL